MITQAVAPLPVAPVANDNLLSRADSANTALSFQLAALPNQRDLATENDRERVWDKEKRLMTHQRMVGTARDAFTSVVAQVEPLTRWRDLLAEGLGAFNQRLTTLSPAQRTDREGEELMKSIDILQRGPTTEYGEVQTPALWAWMTSHGVVPVRNRLFEGRSGLIKTSARLEALGREIDAARANLERALTDAEQLLKS
jgi:hypothetical protein